jgi:hypothetical protein
MFLFLLRKRGRSFLHIYGITLTIDVKDSKIVKVAGTPDLVLYISRTSVVWGLLKNEQWAGACIFCIFGMKF